MRDQAELQREIRFRAKTPNVDDVLAWQPCAEYTRGRVEQLFAGRDTIDALDVLRMPIPADHALWAVLRDDMIEADLLRGFAVEFSGEEPDPLDTLQVAAMAARGAALRRAEDPQEENERQIYWLVERLAP